MIDDKQRLADGWLPPDEAAALRAALDPEKAFELPDDDAWDLWKVAADEWVRQRTALRAEVEHLTEIVELRERLHALTTTELIALRPVIDAARAWRKLISLLEGSSVITEQSKALAAAVDALDQSITEEGQQP